MKKLTLVYNPESRHEKVRFTFDDVLLVQTNMPMPGQDDKHETVRDEYQYIYAKEFPITEILKSIKTQIEHIDFNSLFLEEQIFSERTLHSPSLKIGWGFCGLSVTVHAVDSCINHEANRIYVLVLSLFSETGLEKWYVLKK